MVMFELRDRLSRYFAFSRKEVKEMSIAVLIIGFVFSFSDWGADSFDFLLGLRNLIITVFIAGLSFLVHETAHRVMALWIGFKAEFKIWWGGLIASLIIIFVSNGRIPLVLPGGMVLALLSRHRLGEFRYGWNYWENGIISIYGPVSNMILAFGAKIFLDIFPNSYFFHQFFILNIVFAICTMLPIPPLDGVNTFFGGRMLYVISFAGIIAVSLLLVLPKVLSIPLALLIAIVIAAIPIALYYFTIEHKPE